MTYQSALLFCILLLDFLSFLAFLEPLVAAYDCGQILAPSLACVGGAVGLVCYIETSPTGSPQIGFSASRWYAFVC